MTATLLTFPVFRAFDSNGAPLAGGLLYSYQAGTTTPLATYVDQAGVTQNTNPVVLDSTGTANVWLGDSTYKLVLKDKDGVQQWSVDNIQSEGNQISSAVAGVYSDFANTSDVAKGDALVGVKQPFTGAVARTQHLKNKEYVSVLDFGADPTGITDSTSAFSAAQEAADCVHIPAGTYLIGSTVPFLHKHGKTFFGDGIYNTWLKQGNHGGYAWWVLSGTGTSPTLNTSYNQQIVGAKLVDVGFQGSDTTPTVPAFVIEAHTPYIVAYSEFNVYATQCFNSLKMICGDALETYANKISVWQDDPSAGNGSFGTGVILAGYVNEYYMNIARSQSGVCIEDSGWNSTYTRGGSDGKIILTGVNGVWISPTIESWTGTASGDTNAALEVKGTNWTFVSPILINVPSDKANVGISFNNGGDIVGTIIDGKIFGTVGSTAPTYPISLGLAGTNLITITNFSTPSGAFRLEQFNSADAMSKCNFYGDCYTITHWKSVPQWVQKGANVASDTSIDPTGLTFHVTGTSAIQTITLPFTDFVGSITIIPNGAFTTTTGGNIAKASTAVVGRALVMTYDGTSWYPSY